MQASKVLMLIGSALVNSEAGRRVASIEIEDVLGVMGLTRRRSHFMEGLALVGVGAAVGAGVALLLAPATGIETRKRLSQSVDKLGQQAVAKLEQVASGSGLENQTNHGVSVLG